MIYKCKKCKREVGSVRNFEKKVKCGECGGVMEKIISKNESNLEKNILYGGIGLIVMILLMMSIFIIPAGERGVLLTFGKPNQISLEEGLHFKIPLAQKVIKYEVRTTKIETQAGSASRDLQDVQTTIALNYHLSPESVPRLHQEIGRDFQGRIINPAIQESVKAVTARFTAEELITRRAEVRTDIQSFITDKLIDYHIIVDDFNIVDFQFSEEFDKAIEQKVTAEQLKLKAERDLERIKVEAEQVKTQADAEAYSLKLKNDAIANSPDIVQLKQIEIQEKAIAKWDGILPQVTGGAIPFIDIRSSNQTGGLN